MPATIAPPPAALPRANTASADAAAAFPRERFVPMRDVPIFAEHQRTDSKGRLLKFGRAELEAIVARCNQRITETGDYAGVTIGHTPDPEAHAAGQAEMPELVGFAGPFRLGLANKPGQRERYAILADMHIFKDRWDAVQRHPRRSPELWIEDKYGEMVLDPIALLGAEVPRLDMGLTLYAATLEGRQVLKYAAASPSAASTFTPVEAKPPRDQYAAAAAPPPGTTTMALSPEDVQTIVDAVMQTESMQWVASQMQASGAGEAGADQTPLANDAAGGPGAGPDGAAAAGAPPPPVAAKIASDVRGDERPEKMAATGMQYQAAGSADGKPGPCAAGSADGDDGPTTAKYGKRLIEMEKQLAEERSLRVNGERRASLETLRYERILDVDREFERVRYGKATDDQFTEHLASIRENYQPIPVGESLPTSFPRTPGKKANYSKDVADRALHRAKQKAMRGEAVDFDAELAEAAAAG